MGPAAAWAGSAQSGESKPHHESAHVGKQGRGSAYVFAADGLYYVVGWRSEQLSDDRKLVNICRASSEMELLF